jgi:hypothetical protein
MAIFRLFVFAFPEDDVECALRIDEIERRPMFVFEDVPYGVAGIDRDRIVDLDFLGAWRMLSTFFSNGTLVRACWYRMAAEIGTKV